MELDLLGIGPTPQAVQDMRCRIHHDRGKKQWCGHVLISIAGIESAQVAGSGIERRPPAVFHQARGACARLLRCHHATAKISSTSCWRPCHRRGACRAEYQGVASRERIKGPLRRAVRRPSMGALDFAYCARADSTLFAPIASSTTTSTTLGTPGKKASTLIMSVCPSWLSPRVSPRLPAALPSQ